MVVGLTRIRRQASWPPGLRRQLPHRRLRVFEARSQRSRRRERQLRRPRAFGEVARPAKHKHRKPWTMRPFLVRRGAAHHLAGVCSSAVLSGCWCAHHLAGVCAALTGARLSGALIIWQAWVQCSADALELVRLSLGRRVCVCARLC